MAVNGTYVPSLPPHVAAIVDATSTPARGCVRAERPRAAAGLITVATCPSRPARRRDPRRAARRSSLSLHTVPRRHRPAYSRPPSRSRIFCSSISCVTPMIDVPFAHRAAGPVRSSGLPSPAHDQPEQNKPSGPLPDNSKRPRVTKTHHLDGRTQGWLKGGCEVPESVD